MVDAIFSHRDETVNAIWSQLIKFRLPAQIVEHPVFPHPALLVLIKLIPTIAGPAVTADDFDDEVGRAIQIGVSKAVEVFAGDEQNIWLTAWQVGSDFHLKRGGKHNP